MVNSGPDDAQTSIAGHHTVGNSLRSELVAHLWILRRLLFHVCRASFNPSASLRQLIFCLGTVDLRCEKVASLIRPAGF
jgi:hypothetical protein